jgi:hypothetical protein
METAMSLQIRRDVLLTNKCKLLYSLFISVISRCIDDDLELIDDLCNIIPFSRTLPTRYCHEQLKQTL